MSTSNTPPGHLSRRDVLSVMGVAGAAALLPGALVRGEPPPAAAGLATPANAAHPLTLPPLPYPDDALEPAIDKATMAIHHDKHHKAYVDNANKALAGTALAGLAPLEILNRLGDAPAEKRMAIRNNVGGHVNHSLFWEWMGPQSLSGAPSASLAPVIDSAFGSLKGLRDAFNAAATSRFGSGWAWLIVNEKGALTIASTANQDTPFMGGEVAGVSGVPILGVDVWEHAYYLKYQNRRADYLAAWWTVVSWKKVNTLYEAAISQK